MAVAPHASHRRVTRPHPTSPHSRVYWTFGDAGAGSDARSIQNPEKSPKNDDAHILDFAELIRHTISNQVKNPVLPQSHRSATAIRRQ